MSATAITAAAGEDDLDAVRVLFREYADWLQVDYCLKDLEAELAGLPGDYAPPGGGLWLARADGALAGCVGLRPLDEGVCEMRRLWVRKPFRGLKLGRGLAEAALAGARAAGHARLSLETLGSMAAARNLYASLGFHPEARDYDGLDDDLRYMVCDLTRPAAA